MKKWTVCLMAAGVGSFWGVPVFSLDLAAVSGGRKPFAVATFECLGVYYRADEAGACKVRYRPADRAQWCEGLELIYDARDGQYRGSLVGLTPDTEYVVQLECGGKQVDLRARTRSETFPVGKTTTLTDRVLSETLHITESGTPEAYHLVTPAQGSKTTVDVRNTADCTVVIDADYVILRGLELRNAARHGVLIKNGRHDIVVEDCRITYWGRIGGPLTFGNPGGMDSAVAAETGAGNLVIQRNLIEHPRGASNDWDTGHPNGPQGVTLKNSSGGNIIRYNEIRSTEDHGFNDAIGGGHNFSDRGSPNRDSDIYGNFIRNVWDDAIESEGANRNVRIWGNYIDLTYQFIATASTTSGPLYVFRNVFGRSRRTHRDSRGGCMIKVGSRDDFGGGRRYIIHNTALQPGGAASVFSGHNLTNCFTRNNVFYCRGGLACGRPGDPTCDCDYDYFIGGGGGPGQEEHGIRGPWTPRLLAESHELAFYPLATIERIQGGKIPIPFGGKDKIVTDPVITIPNPIIDAGVPLAGFNDDYAGAAPDLGAFELGRPPLRFGRRAAGTVWAPWEMK